MTRRSILALPFASALAATRWEETPFPNWSEKLVERIVTDSPWARPFRTTIVKPFDGKMVSSFSQIGIGLPNPFPGGNRGARTPAGDHSPLVRIGVDLIIRWASALPVRRAFALGEFGRNGLDHPRALELLVSEPSHFLIQIAGLPRVLFGEDGKALRTHLERTRLAIPGQRILRPETIDLPSIGRELTVTLRFARSTVPEDAANLELLAALENQEIEQRFKVRSMFYNGRLEL